MCSSTTTSLWAQEDITTAFQREKTEDDPPQWQTFKEDLNTWRQMITEVYDSFYAFQLSELEADRNRLRKQWSESKKEAALAFETARASAIELYKAAPNRYKEVEQLLFVIVRDEVAQGRHERAVEVLYPFTDHLINLNGEEEAFYQQAFKSAQIINDYESVRKYYKYTFAPDRRDKVVSPLPISDAEKSWNLETEVRKKEESTNLPRVELETTKGKIIIELFENEAPNTVANFITLVEKGFYDGLTFHRVLRNENGFAIAQGGDPNGNGTGGPGYFIPCECYQANARLHFRGSISMAHGGKNTGGSQFFFALNRIQNLDRKHTVFGRIVEGIDIAAQLQLIDPEKKEDAIIPDEILSAKVLRKRDHQYNVNKVDKDQQH